LITDAEVSKGTLPGVERAIPKSKGLEFASLLHQFAVDHAQSHKNPNVVAVFKDMGMTSKPKAAPPPPKPLPSTKATTPTKPPVTSETSARVVTKGTGPKPPIKVVKDKPLTAPPPAKAEGGPAVKTTKSPSPPPPPASGKTIAAEAKSPVTKKTPVADKAKGAGKKPTANKPLPIKKGTEKLGTKKKEPPRPAKAKKPPTANKTPGKRLPVKPATKKKSKPR
jgi:endonuclease-3